MYVGTIATTCPEKPAVIMSGSGRTLSYGELDDRSLRIAQYLRDQGLQTGDNIVLLMENTIEFVEVLWAAFRSGLLVATPNGHSNSDDVAYILKDCRAKVLFTSKERFEVARDAKSMTPCCKIGVLLGGEEKGWAPYEAASAYSRRLSPNDEWMGHVLNYTSGTTGRPKGVIRPSPALRASELWPRLAELRDWYKLSSKTIYLSPAPLYHGAPTLFVRAVHCFGGTVVVMEKFEAPQALWALQRYQITHSQWVPTMFVRMLKIDEAERTKYNLSRHEVAIHAAGPCPIDVKRKMIDWWGEIVHEYYGATDAAGMTHITSEEWLRHPGSVGAAPSGLVRICNEDGIEVMPGEAGLIYFVSKMSPPEYLNDPEKSRAARHPRNDRWATVGDIGFVKNGYLFLTDRKSFVINSGGVNIYPQAIEDALLAHPAVMDAAVFGVPNLEMGEEVKAVVELVPGMQSSESLANDLLDYCGTHLARHMVPKSLDFTEKLPRTAAGKLLKKDLRAEYLRRAELGVASSARPASYAKCPRSGQ